MPVSEQMQKVFDKIDREAPLAVKNQFKAWGSESAKLWITDHGFRLRRLRAMGLDHYDKNDHDGIAAALRGAIHGDYLARREMPPWRRGSLYDRWILVGYRVGELRLARAARRRSALKIVEKTNGL